MVGTTNERIILGLDTVCKDRLYTVGELLNFVPLSRSGLYGVLQRCEVPCVKLNKRAFYLGEDFLKFIEDNKI